MIAVPPGGLGEPPHPYSATIDTVTGEGGPVSYGSNPTTKRTIEAIQEEARAAGYKADLLAGLRFAQAGLDRWGPSPDYYPEIWEELEDAIGDVEATGELPKVGGRDDKSGLRNAL
jgi:hypothetical protein